MSTFMDQIRNNQTDVAEEQSATLAINALLKASLMKTACVVATTANIADLATGLAAGATIDGVTLAAGNRVLVKDQTDAKTNGIYVVTTTEPIRADDFDAGAEMSCAFVPVAKGTAGGMKLFQCTAVDITVGTTNITFAARAFA